MLYIIGFASIGLIYYLRFTFIRDKKEDIYEVILSYLTKVYKSLGLDTPRTILTDKEKALINAIKIVFPTTKNMIYI